MWRNPNYPAPDPPAPPQETGRRLLTLPRPDGAELRVSLDEFNGHNYISLRVWEPGRGGPGMWPTRKGVTVRLRECADLARVLTETARTVLADGPGRRQGTEGQGDDQGPAKGFSGGAAGETGYDAPRGRAGRPPFDPATMPKLEGNAGFDEFGG